MAVADVSLTAVLYLRSSAGIPLSQAAQFSHPDFARLAIGYDVPFPLANASYDRRNLIGDRGRDLHESMAIPMQQITGMNPQATHSDWLTNLYNVRVGVRDSNIRGK